MENKMTNLKTKMNNLKINYRNLVKIKQCELCGISKYEIPNCFLEVELFKSIQLKFLFPFLISIYISLFAL